MNYNQKIEGLEKRTNEQDTLLAKIDFKDLELKEQVILVIVLIDRIRGKA
ncbi:MAG TPA: hypothetical protein VFI70_02675 [Nitrososphaeraceae archaeon]|nr:hypothetical protein [Nitrososphaeraceae archaeon]